MTYLYVHTTPIGKRYVGIADDYEDRWDEGRGYRSNESFYSDIKFYGWDNIKHDIIQCFEDRKEAEFYEALYIVLLDSENDDMGYNNTKIKENLMKKYREKSQIKCKKKSKTYKEYTTEEQDTIEKFNMPWTALSHLINEWIFNERSRQMLKRRLYDGLSFNELASEFNMSIQHCKSIIYKCQTEIYKHI